MKTRVFASLILMSLAAGSVVVYWNTRRTAAPAATGTAPAAVAKNRSSPTTVPTTVPTTAAPLATPPAQRETPPRPRPTRAPLSGPIHAMRLDYPDLAQSRALVEPLEKEMRQAGINLVSLGAGRAEWAYFNWKEHPEALSNEVRSTGIDFLAEDSARFNQWAQVDAAIDCLSPLYIQSHPQAAAISLNGQPSGSLVSLMEIVEGDYGRRLLAMEQAIAAGYPVDSITMTELIYQNDGYGPQDLAAYRAYSQQADWPRRPDGQIEANDARLNAWRAYELGRFFDQAGEIAHRYGKQFYVDTPLDPESIRTPGDGRAPDFNQTLQHVDKIVVWGYFNLDELPPGALAATGKTLASYPAERVILTLGLWNKYNGPVPAERLQEAVLAAQAAGLNNLWLTPSSRMSDEHWSVLRQLWGSPGG